MFLEDLGLKESGLEKLIKASYSLLGLISYLTAGPIESKAWTITRGTKAPQAAGKIHSDFERGFIKADVISYEDLIANGSMTAARDKGLVRSEGKEYVMQDGDVVLFKLNTRSETTNMAYWLQWILCYGSKMNETVGGDLRTEDDSFYLL